MITQGRGTARSIDGSTGKQLTNAFVTVKTAGIRELAEKLDALGARMGEPKALENCVKLAGEHIKKAYKSKVGNATGNLRKSVRIEVKTYDAAAVAIIGPWQTGTSGATSKQASGNHAWLYEWGSGPRRAGTNGRRTYLNVHQVINGKMRRHSSANDQQFANMSKGYYFLMGSKNEPTRQARMGKGYPHDFCSENGEMHPFTLHPGETYPAMPAHHAMRNTISEQSGAVLNTLQTAIQNTLDRLTK